ncbi:MAG: hypothetical protein QOI06_2347 [Nocardioidaceae bacterium]|nr:hypothetical protein [Nocardioidaceae bacterium]
MGVRLGSAIPSGLQLNAWPRAGMCARRRQPLVTPPTLGTADIHSLVRASYDRLTPAKVCSYLPILVAREVNENLRLHYRVSARLCFGRRTFVLRQGPRPWCRRFRLSAAVVPRVGQASWGSANGQPPAARRAETLATSDSPARW